MVPLFAFPALGRAFSLAALSGQEWLAIFGLSLLPLIFGEVSKMVAPDRR
jgi:hypothetical protein